VFVSFEGIDGAGKSTLIAALKSQLEREGRSVVVTREPGAGALGSSIRNLILNGGHISARAELFLFLADRSEHVSTLIRPALDSGKIVLCDRFADSTVVYQGYGRGFDIDQLREWNSFATDRLMPDLTFLLDLSLEISAARAQKGDRLDLESNDFRQLVRHGFLNEAERDPNRWITLDASLPPESLQEQAMKILRSRLV